MQATRAKLALEEQRATGLADETIHLQSQLRSSEAARLALTKRAEAGSLLERRAADAEAEQARFTAALRQAEDALQVLPASFC